MRSSSSSSCASRPSRVAKRGSSAHGSAITARERAPVAVVAAGDRDPAVVAPRRVDVVRRHRGRLVVVAVRHALAAQAAPVDRVVEHGGAEQRRARVGAAHVDPLALAGPVAVQERGEDRDRHEVAAVVVHVGEAPAGGRQVGQARREGQPAAGLHDRTPRLERRVRARVAEAAVRHVDDVGAQLAQPVVAEAPAFEHAGREVLGDDVGDAHELGEQLLAALGPQVERDARASRRCGSGTRRRTRRRAARRRRAPSRGGCPSSPCVTGSSILMTCAPNAASTRVAPAPASWPVKSQIRKCESAPVTACTDPRSRRSTRR